MIKLQILCFSIFLILLCGVGASVPMFNGKDLSGWDASDMSYWSVKDRAIVGHVQMQGTAFYNRGSSMRVICI